MGKKIIFEGNRHLKTYDININQYYKELADLWNAYQEHFEAPTDGRTNYYKDYEAFFDKLLYLWDMIRQTQAEHSERIKILEQELNTAQEKLSKWTSQQTGRNTKLTEEDKQIILSLHLEGTPNRKIGEKFGLSEGAIRYNLKNIKDK